MEKIFSLNFFYAFFAFISMAFLLTLIFISSFLYFFNLFFNKCLKNNILLLYLCRNDTDVMIEWSSIANKNLSLEKENPQFHSYSIIATSIALSANSSPILSIRVLRISPISAVLSREPLLI